MNIFQFISVQVLHKRIRRGGRVKVAADMLTRGGEGGQNFGKSAYVILERSLILCEKQNELIKTVNKHRSNTFIDIIININI